MTIGERIKKRRKDLNLRQHNVAKACGVRSPTISQWENDINQPRSIHMAPLCQILDTNPDFLLYGKTSETKTFNSKQPSIKMIPTIEWHDAATFGTEDTTKYKPNMPLAPGIEADFALAIEGTSMHDIARHGDIAFFNIDKKPQHGDAVLALLEGQESPVFRILKQIDSNHLRLGYGNKELESLPDTTLTPADKIIAVYTGKLSFGLNR